MNKTQEILVLIDNGMTAKEISETVGCHRQLPYGVARRYGKTIARAKETPLAKYDEQIRNMRKDGKTILEIAETFNSTKDSVKWYCRTRGIAIPRALKKKNERKASRIYKNTEADVRRKIAERNPKLEYVSGYTTNHEPVVVRCLECGEEFSKKFHEITVKGSGCPYCREEEAARRRAERQRAEAQKEAEREARREAKRAEREERIKKQQKEKEQKRKEREHPCAVCGAVTSRPVYCSDKCAKKAERKRREIKRRHAIEKVMVDKDITVKGLYKRDNGVCHICGRKCNTEDYVMNGDVFIAGDWYPSIDHIIPLAKGGEHSWGNVALAHRRCNSLKSDKSPAFD